MYRKKISFYLKNTPFHLLEHLELYWSYTDLIANLRPISSYLTPHQLHTYSITASNLLYILN
jgi:hypothetical protein